MSSMMFMNGTYATYIVKWIINKLHLDFLQENTLQSKITGWTADYLFVCAFIHGSVFESYKSLEKRLLAGKI